MNNINHPPIPDSYWVIPGKLAAGVYPGSRFFEEETRRRLSDLMVSGVNFFLDLTTPDELPPYEKLLQEQSGWLEKEASYRRMAVPDMQSPDEAQMVAILNTIDIGIRAKKVVYVHCYAGIGRTGTVIGCYLTRHGMPGAEALNTIALMRAGLDNGWVRSPETDEQVEFVLNWEIGK